MNLRGYFPGLFLFWRVLGNFIFFVHLSLGIAAVIVLSFGNYQPGIRIFLSNRENRLPDFLRFESIENENLL